MRKKTSNFVGRERKFRNRFYLFFVVVTMIFSVSLLVTNAANNAVVSPNGRLRMNFYLHTDGAPRYSIELDGKTVLLESKLGLVREDADFSVRLKLLSASKMERVRDRYEILTAKRRFNDYQANRAIFHLATAAGKKLDVIFQVSDDGAAYRYFFP